MELTGKCKEEFLVWYFNTYLKKNKYLLIKDIEGFFLSIEPVLQNALIIEWFDSVGIYIDIRIEFNDSFVLKTFDSYAEDDYVGNFTSRQEAIIQAIKIANEIYNSTHL